MIDLLTALRRGLHLGALSLLALVLVACANGDGNGNGNGTGTTDPNDSGRTATVSNGSVDVSADGLAFDVDRIEAPAGEAFTIVFTNEEGQPHNVAIHTERGGEDVAIGDIITGPDATEEIDVPALEAGEYYFECTVHPDMNGTLVVE